MNPVARRQSGETEFFAVCERLGIAPDAMVDPRTELTFAMARRSCRKCVFKEKCRQVLRRPAVTPGAFLSFCPSADLLVALLSHEPMHESMDVAPF